MTGGRPGTLRRALDLFYAGCGLLAGICLVGIAVFVVLQIVARPAGIVMTWTDEFAGYAMAASSFLALAYTFNTGGHIRVGMLLDTAPPAGRRWLDGLCLVMAIAIVGYFAWSSVVMTWQSYQFNEMGQGTFGVPLWMPQTPMTLGLVAMTVALVDNLVNLIRRGETFYKNEETATAI